MKKNIILVLSMLCAPIHAKINPIKLEAEALKIFDGTLITSNTVRLVKKYLGQVHHFMQKKNNLNNNLYTLINLVRLEEANTLPQESKELFKQLSGQFIEMSEQFLEHLQTVKSTVVTIVDEVCTKRNRSDSLLLKWAHTPVGQEHDLFYKEITTYRSLCTFCIDVACFLEDFLYSCPKATEEYKQEAERFTMIRKELDDLLAADQCILTSNQYKQVLATITKKYNSKIVESDKIAKLYYEAIQTIRT